MCKFIQFSYLKMTLSDSKSLTFRIAAVVVLILAAKCNCGEFPIPVGLYTKQIRAFESIVESCLRARSNKFYLSSDSEKKVKDLIVKFKGEILSWRNLTKLLRYHNVTIPDEGSILHAVLQDKNSRDQSCERRCFLDERRFRHKTCFCDKACRTFGDCCLDFHLR